VLSFLSQFLAILLGITLSLEIHAYFQRRRTNPNEPSLKMTLRNQARKLLPQEKAEYFAPMTAEEYENHMEELSGRNDLLRKLDKFMPWNSQPPKSPPSDS